jgi:hypothetical protein
MAAAPGGIPCIRPSSTSRGILSTTPKRIGRSTALPSRTPHRPQDVRLRGNGNDHVGLDDLLQRVAPIDDRPDLPGLDEFLEEDKVLGTPTSRT